MEYDVIIVGAGPAGLTAAIYSARYKLKTLIIGENLGGWTSKANSVENFPSYEKISGPELITKMSKQVKNLGVDIRLEEILDVKKSTSGFEIVTNKSKYYSKRIILATGTEKVKLGLEKEKELTGKGVSYCATCDAPLYKEKIICVVGGGNSALKSAMLLSKYGKKVFIVYRKSNFCKAEPINIEELKKNKKITPIFDSQITELIGDKKLKAIKLSNGKEICLDGLFVEIGSIPNTKLAEKLKVKLDCENIFVDRMQRTSVKGIFAAGDVTNNPLKQIITACGEGAIAANTVFKELGGK